MTGGRWAALCLAASLAGCASGPPAADPSGRWRAALADAANHPATWLPLAGAAAAQAGGLDRKLAAWAHEQQPLFRSTADARGASGSFLAATHVAMAGTALAATEQGHWAGAKARRLVAHFGGVLASELTVSGLKRATARPRPDQSDHRSFPSGNTARASAAAAAATVDLDALPLGHGGRRLVAWSVGGLAGITGWARLEEGKHYPADVLAGVAVGNFVARLLHGVIMGPSAPRASVTLGPRSMAVSWVY